MRPSERPPSARSTGRPVLIPAALALAVALAGCGNLPRPATGAVRSQDAPPPAVASQEGDEPDPIANDLLARHNTLRAEHDLPPLSLSPRLSDAARVQAAGMIELGKAQHEGADGSTPADRVERRGYHFANVGENVAFGQETAEQVMDGWMNSPGHRRNILGDFEQMGAAREDDAEGQPYWCVVFATPIPQLDPGTAAADLIRRINERRSQDDLPPLEGEEALMGVALDHARTMAESGSLDPEGSSAIDALNAAGIGYRRVALSVASGPSRPADLLESITSDASRRRDVLGDFDRVGVGYATSEKDGQPYWSVIFLQAPSP